MGSMDGAMKFVKGDAIAGIIVTVINIVGGLAIGVLQKNMAVGDAAKKYSLLTIGDGLVGMIPAILISTAAGIIVTRVGGEEEGSHLGKDVTSQLLAFPKAIAIAGGMLFGLALVPGLPKVPFFVLSLAAGGGSYMMLRKKKPATDGIEGDVGENGDAENGDSEKPKAIAPPERAGQPRQRAVHPRGHPDRARGVRRAGAVHRLPARRRQVPL